MTIEEQKYIEECRKKLEADQIEVIQMAFQYGLGIKDVRRVAIPKLNAEQMRQTVFAMLEDVDGELVDLCCQGTFDQYQIPEIVSGSVSGLTKEEIMSYATPDLPASRMKKMRTQLIEAKKNAGDSAEGAAFKEYTENLIKMMETSLQQFKENNEKFEVLSTLVKEHVLDEKNQEIKDLYENLKDKDGLIKKLQEEAAARETQIKKLEEELTAARTRSNDEVVEGKTEVFFLFSITFLPAFSVGLPSAVSGFLLFSCAACLWFLSRLDHSSGCITLPRYVFQLPAPRYSPRCIPYPFED